MSPTCSGPGTSSTRPSARRRRAGATAPSSSGSARFGEVRFVTPQDRGEIERTIEMLIEQKARSFARMGVANMFARPGWQRILHRRRDQPAHARSGPCQPARRRVDLGGDQSRPDLPRHLLSRAGELRRRRDVALRAGRRASARPDALCDRARAQAFRFHHRRRALQARMVGPHDHALRSRGRRLRCAAGRSAALVHGHRRLKRFIKQNEALWSAVQPRARRARIEAARRRPRDDAPETTSRKSPPIAPQ